MTPHLCVQTEYTVSACWVRTLSSSMIPLSNENHIPRLQFQYQYHHCHSTISVSVSISLNGIPRFGFQYQYQRIKSCDINTHSIPIFDRYCGFDYGILFGFNSIAHPCTLCTPCLWAMKELTVAQLWLKNRISSIPISRAKNKSDEGGQKWLEILQLSRLLQGICPLRSWNTLWKKHLTDFLLHILMGE